MPAALCGWDSLGVELACDFAQAAAGAVRCLDSFDDLFGELPRAASGGRCWARSGGSSTFGDESFELVDRDQPCAPGHLDRLDVGEDASEKGRAADAERFGGLAARVGEPLDARCLPDDRRRLSRWRRCSGAVGFPGIRGPERLRRRVDTQTPYTNNDVVFALIVHLCLAVYRSSRVAVRRSSNRRPSEASTSGADVLGRGWLVFDAPSRIRRRSARIAGRSSSRPSALSIPARSATEATEGRRPRPIGSREAARRRSV